MAKHETIEVTYRGRTAHVLTCLSAWDAAELRGRWPNGVIELERIRETPALRDENARTWLIRAVCKILKIDDWRAVDRECAGRTEYPRPRAAPRRDFRVPTVHAVPAAPPESSRRIGRSERMRGTR